ncbi:ATP-binding protein [Marinibactrum halimedae]|uniref:Sensory/regulatory protein RpfC n=1 Tax=Marinibactrum halimedae TaxID=1444977 RepID=A0AA37T8W7_9GAMM|nr:ATP-binding protein [Marinibactrum halimedae]MCD9460993.1 ATP-binding protein [Marinibactrum halimedae]GLS24777.1 hypothetical protein GCM10007877_04910 [Marinibactrum halimedae]
MPRFNSSSTKPVRSKNYHSRLLQLLTQDQALDVALSSLATLIERETVGMKASILLLTRDGLQLTHGAAPSLPKEYTDALNGVYIGPAVGSCGTAAFSSKLVIDADLNTAPRWKDYKHLALAAGLQACWSHPITQENNKVLGTFALYYHEPRHPVQEELHFIEEASNLAKVLIEKSLAKQRAEELEEANEAANIAARSKAMFLANMSHEIRTPLNGIIGITDLLKETHLNKEQRDHLKTISFSAKTLLTIINDILDISKIDEGMMKLENVTFNFRDFTAALLSAYQSQANNNVKLKFSIDKNIPDCLSSDPTRLHQILGNILSNAFKFTQSGTVEFKATLINIEHSIATLQFEIRDTGIGIPKDVQEKIFEKFEQADTSTTREFGGSGLGLNICKKLIELFSGEIWVKSQPNKGSCFFIQLPFSVSEKNKNSEKHKKHPNLNFSHYRILVAEDNAVNQKVIAAMLKKFAIDYTIVEDGEQAVEIACQKHSNYNLILMDCEMPKMDGYNATTQIRNWEKQHHVNPITICALTSHAMTEHQEKCLAAGMNHHLAKPVTLNSLQQFLLSIS